MEIFGTITAWRYSDRGNMSVPGANILQIGIISTLWGSDMNELSAIAPLKIGGDLQ